MFRHPIYFVHRVLRGWPELNGPAGLPSPDQIPQKFFHGRDNWTMQTYLRLKARGHNVHIADDYVAGQINVLHYDDLSLKDRPDRGFIVAIQPDRPRAAAADLRIVQNQRQIQRRTDHFMPHWPQPGLIPRDISRGHRVERVGYVGLPAYLAAPYRSADFTRRLADLGMELIVRDSDHTHYADLDAVLAVRDVTPFDLSIKPGSKLVNAWLAGCPALLGAEPAYQQLRQSPDDYIEVKTPDEAIETLRRLKAEPDLYDRMIAHGRQRSQEFSTERMCARWEDLLNGPVTDGFERWRRQPLAWRTMRFAFRALEHKRQRRRFFKLIQK